MIDRYLAFGLAVLAHLLADLCLQKKAIAIGKRGLNRYMSLHVLTHLFLLAPVFWAYFSFSWSLVGAILALTFSHCLFDNFKLWLNRLTRADTPAEDRFWVLIGIDQIFHLLVLWLIFLF